MNDHERTLGKVEEGIEWLKNEINEIKLDVKALNQFKWKVGGVALILSIAASILIEVVITFGH